VSLAGGLRLRIALQEPHHEPDRHDDDDAEQEVAERPVERVEAEVGDTPHQQLQALDNIEQVDAQGGEHDSHHHRQQDEPDHGAGDAVAEELASIHGVISKCPDGALAPDFALA